jgi:hypothetical protein
MPLIQTSRLMPIPPILEAEELTPSAPFKVVARVIPRLVLLVRVELAVMVGGICDLALAIAASCRDDARSSIELLASA